MQETGRKTVTLVLGGVRSGKSRWAQELAAKAVRVAYFATVSQFLIRSLGIIASLFKLGRHCAAYVRGSGASVGSRGLRHRHRHELRHHWQTFEELLELGQLMAERMTA